MRIPSGPEITQDLTPRPDIWKQYSLCYEQILLAIRGGPYMTPFVDTFCIFALSLKAAFAILAFAGVVTLWQAIAADMGASLLVVANGLRLLKPKNK